MVLEGSEDKGAMSKAEYFDAREYFFATVRWFDQWPICAIEQFEQAGFKNIRLEHVEPHPVWQLRMKCPRNNLSSTQAGRVVRTVVERRGKIPRDGFFCSVDRRGIVQAGFVLEV
jgi:hypothetical protein